MSFLRNLKKRFKRTNEDRADSNTIAFIFVTLLLLMTTLTIIDVGTYFLNRTMVSNAAMNGARLTSVYGGTGGVNGTSISAAYGTSVSGCKNNSNPVVCSVERELANTSMIDVRLGSKSVGASNAIVCGPTTTSKIGERTYCQITWTYKGMPGSALSFARRNPTSVTKMSAESEVGL